MADEYLLARTEGYELANAHLHAVGRQHGIRLLTIKGPTLHGYGLRPRRTSSDLDILVDPEQFEDLCALMVESGWHALPGLDADVNDPPKGRTYLKANWPLSIDIHWRYPGFLAPAPVVFEELWARSRNEPAAGMDCRVPDRVGSAIILAFHSLASTKENKRHAAELAYLTSKAALSVDELEHLENLAQATGAVLTLDRFFTAVQYEARLGPWDRPGEPLDEWRQLTGAERSAGVRLLHRLHRTRLRDYPRVVWRSFWLPTELINSLHPRAGATRKSRIGFRFHRLWVGLLSLPSTLNTIRNTRRGRAPELDEK